MPADSGGQLLLQLSAGFWDAAKAANLVWMQFYGGQCFYVISSF